MVGRKRKAAPAAVQEDVPETPVGSSSRRRSKRTSATKTSKYFEPESDSEPDLKPRHKSSASKPRSKKPKLEDDEFAEEDDYKDDPQVNGATDNDDEDEVEEDEDDDDEDAPPKVTFVPLPKLRDTGGVEYADDRLHQNTLEFLKDLKANNKRPWLKSHDEEFRRSLKDWESYVMSLTDKIISADETIPELPFKDVNFRIYRDVRFSHDPTPYKAHYGAAWSRTGRKGPYACYYVHLEPGGKCFVGGGLWHPDADAVAKLRASIDERPERWRRALMDPLFRETFFPGVGLKAKTKSSAVKGQGKGRGRKSAAAVAEEEEREGGGGEEEEKAVKKAFAEANKENALKTKPKGFVAEHRDIELLKLRNFTVGKKVPDSIFTDEDGQDKIQRIVSGMVGFVTHLNHIVMPDPGDDDDSEDEG